MEPRAPELGTDHDVVETREETAELHRRSRSNVRIERRASLEAFPPLARTSEWENRRREARVDLEVQDVLLQHTTTLVSEVREKAHVNHRLVVVLRDDCGFGAQDDLLVGGHAKESP